MKRAKFPPGPDAVWLSVRVPPDLLAQLRDLARAEDRSISSLARLLLASGLNSPRATGSGSIREGAAV